MSTNHGMDENDVIEIVMNDQPSHNAAIALGDDAVNNYGNDNPAGSWDLCKSVGEDIRDEVIREDAKDRHRLTDRERTLTESLFARMLGCVDWAEVGRHYINEAIEMHAAEATR